MIYLLLGKDGFSKKEYFEALIQDKKPEIYDFDENSKESEVLAAAQNGSLFGAISGIAPEAGLAKILRLKNFLSAGNFSDGFIESIKRSGQTVVFFEDSLDKRKSGTKKILADKDLKLLEFNVPEGTEFKNWVVQRSRKIDLNFSSGALDKFLQRMGLGQGNTGEQLYDLWQADSELKKLKAFAGDGQVGAFDVENLVSENIDENVFKITNALGDKDARLTVKLLTDYLDRIAEGDDKSKIIGLSALLADQLRNIMLIQHLLSIKASDAEMAKSAGFTPGRIFVFKKLARNFETKKTADALRKLELLDEEIKTSNSPASLLFFMIVRDLIAV